MFFVGKNSGHELVDRGDPDTTDFPSGAFTKDGEWHTLDLSSVVPKGAVGVIILIDFKAIEAGQSLNFRKLGNINFVNMLKRRTIIADVVHTLSGLIYCDSDAKIEYNIVSTTWTMFNFYVRGWFI